MPLLYVNVFRENGKFVTNVYKKETFTEIIKFNEILLSNGYSNKFTDKCILKFMNKLYINI